MTIGSAAENRAVTENNARLTGLRRLPAALTSWFVCIYLSLICFPFLALLFPSALPYVGELAEKYVGGFYDAINVWVAVHLFHLSGPVTTPHFDGSGDTTLDYIQTLVWLTISLLLTLLWSSVGRLRRSESAPYPWVRLLVRFYLAYFLLLYGFSKLYPNQFPRPDLSRLTETYGESSPMGLMWAFMGASPAYEIFCGAAEALAGALLLFRRTSTIGALFSTAVMLHIVVLNLCFDVPVKLFSLHLLLMSAFLLAGDFKRLWTFFVLRQAARLEGAWIPSSEKKWVQRSRFALQVLVPLGFAMLIIPAERTRHISVFESQLKVSALSGIWEADGGAGSNATGLTWRRVVLDGGRRIAVWTRDGQLLRFTMKLDTSAHKISFKGWRNDHVCDFSYEEPAAGWLLLKGRIDHLPVEFKLHRASTPAFLLQTRGFHWISEDPYNM